MEAAALLLGLELAVTGAAAPANLQQHHCLLMIAGRTLLQQDSKVCRSEWCLYGGLTSAHNTAAATFKVHLVLPYFFNLRCIMAD
jgi:hypothetical protein